MTRARRRVSAFGLTLIELLVVISIVVLLIGILLPVLGSAREAACRSSVMSDIRQASLAHTMYQHDHAGHVPWGYAPVLINNNLVTVQNTDGGSVYGFPISERFPWRLQRYISGVWDVLYSQQDPPTRPVAGDSNEFISAYTISLFPSLSLNTVYVGGHEGPFNGFPGGSPNNDGYVVFYDRDVDVPSELIVFTEVLARNGDAPLDPQAPDLGLHWSTPPRANGRRWEPDGNSIKSALPGNLQGLPLSRCGIGTPTAFFDGHAKTMTATQLDDMRLWSVAATAADDDPIP
ncbi:MAG: type II secretion system protein [Planctomycetota bacterium]